MKIHCLQHVNFEGLGYIETWISENKHELTYTKFFENATLPHIEDIDFLIIMGGPMSTYDEKIIPWLTKEKSFIKKAIETGKIVLGICLGAQLIADVLGAKVYPNKEKEIGWFEVIFNPSFKTVVNNCQTTSLKVLHWHGDTFDIPIGAVNHASSIACKNQLFSYTKKVVGIQFHLETTNNSLQLMLKNCRDELNNKGVFVQSEKEIAETTDFIEQNNLFMLHVLQNLTL